ncbi:Imidazole glycerol phosphate synthase subunit HisF [Pannonibacter phragmitetus]|uniref:Imidazole glycerol phosphate synthase subunit HisF n=1 Tax=Pannonibacter phragmitetus TaxID=121719 RepID=A0A378ZQS5_9HYPH|nr:AglZ/HisF2 family acetamidino modification protein [Pannonibacter phragmitetus]SUA99140.1 Imidazole glycerol phosphate synthase subunit HisF [Pannonibacter phragmitetus]
MLRSRIIPCLLIHDGGLNKTEKFKPGKYVGDPLNAVKIFNEKQVDELILVDIDATAKGRAPDFERLRSIAIESRMPLCYGGGVATAEQAARIISLGFEKVSVSAAALERPELIREMASAIGSQSVVVTIDVKKGGLFSGDTVFTHNGTRKHKIGLTDWIEQATALGAGEIVINAIDRDGTMSGYDLDLARRARAATELPMTFLGGAGSIADLEALINAVGVCGAAAGSLFVFKGTFKAVLINYERPSQLVS